jgi:hypothetical protein
VLGITLYEKTTADALGFFELEDLDFWWLLGLAVIIGLWQNLEKDRYETSASRGLVAGDLEVCILFRSPRDVWRD